MCTPTCACVFSSGNLSKVSACCFNDKLRDQPVFHSFEFNVHVSASSYTPTPCPHCSHAAPALPSRTSTSEYFVIFLTHLTTSFLLVCWFSFQFVSSPLVVVCFPHEHERGGIWARFGELSKCKLKFS